VISAIYHHLGVTVPQTAHIVSGIQRTRLMGVGMKRLLFVCALLLFATSNCVFGQDVRYNFDKSADFSKFKTYKWVAIKDAASVDELTDKQIKAAIDAELAKKGLTKVEEDSANLLMGYQTAVGTEKQFTSFDSGWGYGPGWYGRGWYSPGGGMTTGQTSTIYTGQLALDMYDSANHDLVWRGVVSKTLDMKAKPDKRQKNLEKAIAKLMKNYPPNAKQ
jgi:hypothetical protein